MAQGKKETNESSNKTKRADNRQPIKRKPRKGKGRRKKKKSSSTLLYNLDFPRILRLLFFTLIVGMIVYHYYLLTEGRMFDTYINLWNNNKKVLLPGIIFVGYTLVVLNIGIRIGKKRVD